MQQQKATKTALVPMPSDGGERVDSTGVLLVNLGTPEAPTEKALKVYLKEFLSDRRVVDLPRWMWIPVLHLVILRSRPKRSAALYQKIWTDDGSPLMVTTRAQAAHVRDEIRGRSGRNMPVAIGMRYGNPSIADALAELRDAGATNVVVVPLFPQYSIATTLSVQDALKSARRQVDNCPTWQMVDDYHDHPGYIAALADSVQQHWRQYGRGERLMISFHGTPERYRDEKKDPYFSQCETTAGLLALSLGLKEDEWVLSFQSRFGPEEWLQPYTDKTLDEWAQTGIGSVDVICPGFASDCLETLEEIAISAAESFTDEGGHALRYIPALNERADHVAALADIALASVSGNRYQG